MTARLTVGDYARFVTTPGQNEENFNSPMLVTAVDKNTDMVTCTREKTLVGVFPDAELVQVPAPVAVPPAPLVPDAIPLP